MADTGGDKDLMSPAEMKPLLVQSKRKPVSCAVGMTKDKQGVLLLDRKVKPRKLMAELKSRAKSEGVDLDMVSVRFGRVAVDDGTAMFTVNKSAPAALRVRLVEKLRPAGVRKVEIGVDEKLEDESDEEETDGEAGGAGVAAAGGSAGAEGANAGNGEGGPGGRGGSAAGAGLAEAGGSGAGTDDTGAGSDARQAAGRGGAAPAARQAGAGAAVSGRDGAPAASGAADVGDGAAAAGAGTQAAGPGAAPAGAGALDKAAVTKRLTGLVKRMVAAMPSHPPQADAMKAVAVQGHKAVQSGDLAGAGRAADTLEKLLGGTPGAGGAAGAVGTGTLAEGAQSSGSAGGASPAGAAPDGAGGDATSGDGPAGMRPGGALAGTATLSAEDASGAGTAGPGADRPARHGPGSPVFDKGRQAWNAVRTKLEGDIQAVLKGVAAEPDAPKDLVEQVHSHVEPIMRQLDDSLTRKLAEIAKGTDAGAHAKLVGEAQAIINRYKAFADSEPMIGILDQNPIRPMTLRKTLDAALMALSKVVQADTESGDST